MVHVNLIFLKVVNSFEVWRIFSTMVSIICVFIFNEVLTLNLTVEHKILEKKNLAGVFIYLIGFKN